MHFQKTRVKLGSFGNRFQTITSAARGLSEGAQPSEFHLVFSMYYQPFLSTTSAAIKFHFHGTTPCSRFHVLCVSEVTKPTSKMTTRIVTGSGELMDPWEGHHGMNARVVGTTALDTLEQGADPHIPLERSG